MAYTTSKTKYTYYGTGSTKKSYPIVAKLAKYAGAYSYKEALADVTKALTEYSKKDDAYGYQRTIEAYVAYARKAYGYGVDQALKAVYEATKSNATARKAYATYYSTPVYAKEHPLVKKLTAAKAQDYVKPAEVAAALHEHAMYGNYEGYKGVVNAYAEYVQRVYPEGENSTAVALQRAYYAIEQAKAKTYFEQAYGKPPM